MESDPFEYNRKDRESAVRIRSWWSVPEDILEDRSQLTALAYEVLLQGSKG